MHIKLCKDCRTELFKFMEKYMSIIDEKAKECKTRINSTIDLKQVQQLKQTISHLILVKAAYADLHRAVTLTEVKECQPESDSISKPQDSTPSENI